MSDKVHWIKQSDNKSIFGLMLCFCRPLDHFKYRMTRDSKKVTCKQCLQRQPKESKRLSERLHERTNHD